MPADSTSAADTQNPAQRLDVIHVVSEAEFFGLERAWNELAQETIPRSVFSRHEWFAAAWAWRRCTSQLRILVARRGDRVVGLLPLISRRGQRSLVVYELLTIPDTQQADLVCAPSETQEVARAFAASLEGDDQWDVLKLDYLPPSGPCVTMFMPALQQRHVKVVEEDAGRNFSIDISGTWREYYDARSRRVKKAMNLAANRLHKQGDVEIECLRSNECEEPRLQAALDASIQISARSWKRTTGYSLDHQGPQAFIRSLSRRAFGPTGIVIWLLRVDRRPLAMEYDLICDGNVHALRGDFDADCNRTSPGTYLFRMLLEDLFDSRLNRYYMGRGENAYKMKWVDAVDPLRRVIAYNGTFNGRREWLREEVVKRGLRRTRDVIWHGAGEPSEPLPARLRDRDPLLKQRASDDD